VSEEVWGHVELVLVEKEQKTGTLLMMVESVVFVLNMGEKGAVRGECCLCNDNTDAV
jgi:hypothetical protein